LRHFGSNTGVTETQEAQAPAINENVDLWPWSLKNLSASLISTIQVLSLYDVGLSTHALMLAIGNLTV